MTGSKKQAQLQGARPARARSPSFTRFWTTSPTPILQSDRSCGRRFAALSVNAELCSRRCTTTSATPPVASTKAEAHPAARGLAGAAIEDARIDFRDLYLALGDLYLEAARAGLETTGEFKEVGALANTEPAGGSTAAMLEGFEESEFFIADV